MTDRPPASESSAAFRRLRLKSQQFMLLDALQRHGSLHRAAAAIHVTQPAATHLLRQLEDGLGVQLFERHRRGIVVTEKGEKLYRHAKRVIALLEETPEAVKGKEAA